MTFWAKLWITTSTAWSSSMIRLSKLLGITQSHSWLHLHLKKMVKPCRPWPNQLRRMPSARWSIAIWRTARSWQVCRATMQSSAASTLSSVCSGCNRPGASMQKVAMEPHFKSRSQPSHCSSCSKWQFTPHIQAHAPGKIRSRPDTSWWPLWLCQQFIRLSSSHFCFSWARAGALQGLHWADKI